jgi:peptide/nickel transport system permease protein
MIFSMTKLKKINWRWTFIADALLILLLIAAGNLSVLLIVMLEAVLWLLRLIWISPILLRFIMRRLMHMIPMLLIVVASGFALIQLAPGDIFTQMALNPNIRPADLETFRRNFGMDLPWHMQFLKFIWNALHGDFGLSQIYKAPVFMIVSQRAANTILLSLVTILVAWGFSIPAGIYASTHQYGIGDQLISILAFIGLSIPNYFLAFLLIFIVSKTGNWLPLGGMHSVRSGELNWFMYTLDTMKHMIIPVFVIATSAMASLTRIMRANMLEIMGQQYIITARAKGLAERKVVYKHALRNAINPMITIFGFQFGAILGGSALVERVLAWPGLGKVMLEAILAQDLYLVVGSLLYGVILLMLGNLLSDIVLAIVDPRVRIS